ncbi:MAG TPA: methyltransferase domain-containing protein [Gemmatimonadaceae bacterium]|nr:methyltransferase domain-containing protein [Gemmatimonadaceae bacterium]
MKRYDRAYFDRWYRDPRTRVKSGSDVARKARMALGVAEYVLGRPVRTVLDVGAGEAPWRTVLRSERPGIEYTGVDSSPYVVRRFGARRNILLGEIGRLDELELEGPFDLVVCCDVLNYLETGELRRGLEHVRTLMGGVAYLELFTSADEMEGDLRHWHYRPTAYYRRLFDRLRLVRCGPHSYVGEALASQMTTLERVELAEG